MAPAELTSAAVSSAVVQSSTIRVRATCTPSAAAASWPKAKASSVRAWPRQIEQRDGQDGRAQPHVAPADPAQRAEQPEQHAPGRLGVGRGHHDEGGQRGEELHGGDPGRGRPGRWMPPRVWLSSSTRAKEQQRPDERARRDRHRSPADAQDDDHDRARWTPRRRRRGRRGRRAGCAAATASRRRRPRARPRRPRRAGCGACAGSRRCRPGSGSAAPRPRPRWEATADHTSGTEMSRGADGDGDRDGQEQQGHPAAPQQAAAQDAGSRPAAGVRRCGRTTHSGVRVRAARRPSSVVRHFASPN